MDARLTLAALGARWIHSGDEIIALAFRCPHCTDWLAAWFKPAPKEAEQQRLFAAGAPATIWTMFGPAATPGAHLVPTHPGYVWTRSGDDLKNVSITPIIAVKRHWVGHIRYGELRA